MPWSLPKFEIKLKRIETSMLGREKKASKDKAYKGLACSIRQLHITTFERKEAAKKIVHEVAWSAVVVMYGRVQQSIDSTNVQSSATMHWQHECGGHVAMSCQPMQNREELINDTKRNNTLVKRKWIHKDICQLQTNSYFNPFKLCEWGQKRKKVSENAPLKWHF